jgi:hydroxymethylpyrimidine/phosphomethylpyrimidine kinase
MAMNLRVLTVAGSDSSGGAGIARDVETIAAFGLKTAIAVTAVTAQSDRHVAAIQPVDPALVTAQMEAALEGGAIRAIKIGMLANAGIVAAVADVLARHPHLPVVLDPVLASTSGRTLLDAEGVRLMIERLLPRVTLVTPNLPELVLMTGLREMDRATEKLLTLGVRAALIKGGHANDATYETATKPEAQRRPPSSPLGEKCRAERGDEGSAGVALYGNPSSGPSGHLLPKGRSGNVRNPHTTPANAGVCRDLLVRPDQPAIAFEGPRHPGTLRGTGCMLASAIATGLAKGDTLEASIIAAKRYVSAAFVAG